MSESARLENSPGHDLKFLVSDIGKTRLVSDIGKKNAGF